MQTDEIADEELPSLNTSKYLKGSELQGKLQKATIVGVGQNTFQDGRTVRQLTVRIGTDEKIFSLNKTNTSLLAQNYGRNTRSWIGKSIGLTSTKRNNPKTGQLVDAIVIVAGA